MLFKPIYNLEHLEYLNKKNLSNHQNLDHLFNIIEDIKRTVQVTHCGSQSNFDQQILKTLNWLKLNK